MKPCQLCAACQPRTALLPTLDGPRDPAANSAQPYCQPATALTDPLPTLGSPATLRGLPSSRFTCRVRACTKGTHHGAAGAAGPR